MKKLVLAVAVLLIFAAFDGNNSASDTELVTQLVLETQEVLEAESMRLRFYYHSIEIDPYVYLLPESFLYIVEYVPVDNYREEFIRLMYEHIGVRILDLWFEGDKLYVDLHHDALFFFNQGTTSSSKRLTIFEKSLLSLPGIASFEVLICGQRGLESEHFNFGHVAIVENGKVVRRDFFVDVDDLSNEPRPNSGGQPTVSNWEDAREIAIDYITNSTDIQPPFTVHFNGLIVEDGIVFFSVRVESDSGAYEVRIDVAFGDVIQFAPLYECNTGILVIR